MPKNPPAPIDREPTPPPSPPPGRWPKKRPVAQLAQDLGCPEPTPRGTARLEAALADAAPPSARDFGDAPPGYDKVVAGWRECLLRWKHVAAVDIAREWTQDRPDGQWRVFMEIRSPCGRSVFASEARDTFIAAAQATHEQAMQGLAMFGQPQVFRPEGDAVKGTLPLVSVGPGGVNGYTQTELSAARLGGELDVTA